MSEAARRRQPSSNRLNRNRHTKQKENKVKESKQPRNQTMIPKKNKPTKVLDRPSREQSERSKAKQGSADSKCKMSGKTTKPRGNNGKRNTIETRKQTTD